MTGTKKNASFWKNGVVSPCCAINKLVMFPIDLHYCINFFFFIHFSFKLLNVGSYIAGVDLYSHLLL